MKSQINLLCKIFSALTWKYLKVLQAENQVLPLIKWLPNASPKLKQSFRELVTPLHPALLRICKALRFSAMALQSPINSIGNLVALYKQSGLYC